MSGAIGAIGKIGSVASLFGKGGSDKGTSSTSIDPESAARSRQLFNLGMGIFNTPFQAYTGQRIAGLTPEQILAKNTAKGLFGDSFSYDPRSELNTMFQDTPSLATTDLSAYQNPYTEQVIDNTLSDLDRARKLQLQSDQDAAIGQGAFGGSRSAILESETNRNFADRAGDIASRLRSQGFDRATNMANLDINRGLQSEMARSNILGNQLADQYRSLGLLTGYGDKDQALNQAGLDFDFNEFIRGYDDPYRKMQMMTSATSGMPYGQTTTTSNRRGLLGRAKDAIGIYDSFDQLSDFFS
jgi:hypothetical protein|tara:strand:- start:2632 stop:3528 length:897 start_codon:yes stop_codon:yes gene_type:complete